MRRHLLQLSHAIHVVISAAAGTRPDTTAMAPGPSLNTQRNLMATLLGRAIYTLQALKHQMHMFQASCDTNRVSTSHDSLYRFSLKDVECV